MRNFKRNSIKLYLSVILKDQRVINSMICLLVISFKAEMLCLLRKSSMILMVDI